MIRLLPVRLLLAAVIAFGWWSTEWADAHLLRYPDAPALSHLENRERSQERNLAHCRYVANNGKGPHVRFHRLCVRWVTDELLETRRALRPKVRPWGPWAFPDSCLREISRRETVGTYSPTIWNYAGSGAYGIGQALPASKMAPYGADYMTNPWTQLRWMVAYVNGRYGGSCAALAFHNRNGWY